MIRQVATDGAVGKRQFARAAYATATAQAVAAGDAQALQGGADTAGDVQYPASLVAIENRAGGLIVAVTRANQGGGGLRRKFPW